MAAKPALVLSILSLLLELPSDLFLLAWAGAHYLCYTIIVSPKHLSLEKWCTVEGTVDGMTVVRSDCSGAKARATDVLGRKVNGTKTWEQQSEILKDLANSFREVLLDPEHGNWISSDSVELKAKMTCQQNTGGKFTASWHLCINGGTCLCLDSNLKECANVPPQFHLMKEKLTDDEELYHLYRTSKAECKSWMKDFMEEWKENVDTTGN
ncbi:UL16-binding protein 1-like [Octodon degus]|uniref:UL16-binding protein 1-like n=1 Tax=Octodon degus TaxID=10160 RepID=A0A6P6DN72_OCTDE|nr:UL16-binding protein 1-like [Octodon degus]